MQLMTKIVPTPHRVPVPPREAPAPTVRPDPELAYDAEWGAEVRRRRRERKISQAQLAAGVGVSQSMISQIENGGEEGRGGVSVAVAKISHRLQMSLPMVAVDPRLRRWAEVGQRLLRFPAIFDYHLQALEMVTERIRDNGPTTSDPTVDDGDPDRPRRVDE